MDDTTSPGRIKTPPHETPEALRTRQLVVLSFWVIILFLGLPIWWKTTTVYRAHLPLKLMEDWADGKICRPTFTLPVAIQALSLPSSFSGSTPPPALASWALQQLLKNTQHALHDLNESPMHHIKLQASEQSTSGEAEFTAPESGDIISVPDDLALLVRLIPVADGHTPRSELHRCCPILDVFYSSVPVHSEGSSASPLAMFIAEELLDIFSEEQALLAQVLGQNSWVSTNSQKVNPPHLLNNLTQRSTRAFRYAPSYHLTFSLFTPVSLPSDWEIEAALKKLISPLLASLSSISDFTVDSQIQFYTELTPSVSPKYDGARNAWTLSKDELNGFINFAEWPLNPNIGAGPTINFILYVPAPYQSPLILRDADGDRPQLELNKSVNWLIPQWGGIQIVNLHTVSDTVSVLTNDRLEPAMHIFSNQLLSLLGLPSSPASLPLRLSTLTRVHAATLIYSASSTIGSLARLTRTLPSIAIPDQVAQSVERSISHLSSACTSLSSGKFAVSLKEASMAEQEAERGFFDKSMVAQVYFPNEHKAVIYVPLIGTIAVPLIASAFKEIRRLLVGKRVA